MEMEDKRRCLLEDSERLNRRFLGFFVKSMMGDANEDVDEEAVELSSLIGCFSRNLTLKSAKCEGRYAESDLRRTAFFESEIVEISGSGWSIPSNFGFDLNCNVLKCWIDFSLCCNSV